MKALAVASCSSSKILFSINGGDSSLYSWRGLNPYKRYEVTNTGFLHLICVDHKPLQPIHVSTPSQESQTALELEAAEETENQETFQSKTVHVKLQLNKECSFGEEFVVVGDDPIFGMWDPENAIPLNWSDGHLWILDLDIPIRKTIKFKFILKEITGKISWQPGPDRILKTWETDNTIVVCEDWEDATLQKLLEEEPNADQREEMVTDDSELLFVAENMSNTNSEMSIDSENLTNENVESNGVAKELVLPPLTRDKPAIADDKFASSEEKPVAIVADNIGSLEVDSAVSSSRQKLGEKRINDKMDGNEAVSEEKIGSKGKFPGVENSVSNNVEEESLVCHEGGPVLVPGLPPLPVDSSEPEIQNEEEKSSTFVASVGVEMENQNLPELDEKQELNENPHEGEMMEFRNEEQDQNKLDEKDHEEEVIKGFSNEEQHHNRLEDKSVANEEKQHESKTGENAVVKNDIQWGRRTIQKLLANFGFVHHQA